MDASDLLCEQLADCDAEQRLAACRVAGRHQPAPDVISGLEACLEDPVLVVAGAAREALTLLRKTEETKILTSAILRENDRSRRWILLDSLLASADPGDSHQPWPEWARKVAGALPHLIRLYIDGKLKKGREELAEEFRK